MIELKKNLSINITLRLIWKPSRSPKANSNLLWSTKANPNTNSNLNTNPIWKTNSKANPIVCAKTKLKPNHKVNSNLPENQMPDIKTKISLNLIPNPNNKPILYTNPKSNCKYQP